MVLSLLGLNSTYDYEPFIKEFAKFTDVYQRMKEAEITYNENLKYIYFNSKIGFTLQSQLLLAPLCLDYSNEIINQKINFVARYIDLLIFTRVTNYKSVEYSTIKTMFLM